MDGNQYVWGPRNPPAVFDQLKADLFHKLKSLVISDFLKKNYMKFSEDRSWTVIHYLKDDFGQKFLYFTISLLKADFICAH